MNFLLTSFLVFSTFLGGTDALAHTPENLAQVLPPSGFLPSSKFYFLERWGENFMSWWLVNPESKIDFQLKLAAERLSELEEELETKGADSPGATIAANLFVSHIQKSRQVIADEREKGVGNGDNLERAFGKRLVKIYKENYNKDEPELTKRIKETEKILGLEILTGVDDVAVVGNEDDVSDDLTVWTKEQIKAMEDGVAAVVE